MREPIVCRARVPLSESRYHEVEFEVMPGDPGYRILERMAESSLADVSIGCRDTDGDGDCAYCARQPERCPMRRGEVCAHCGQSRAKHIEGKTWVSDGEFLRYGVWCPGGDNGGGDGKLTQWMPKR